MIRTLSRQLKILGAALVLGVFPGVASATTVDLLILYDTYSRNYFGGDPLTAMTNWVSQANAAYRDSQVDIQLRLVGVRAHEQAGADMSTVLGNLRLDSTAIALRDQLGADFVSQLHQTGACGVAYVAVDRAWTWSVVGPNCGSLAMTHELGHNMGLNHSRRQGNTTGTRYRYGLGYGVDNQFATIMAYPQSFSAPSTAHFSNPNLRCGSAALPCGLPVGDPNEAYAALALQNVRVEIAAFRPTASSSSSSGGGVTIEENTTSFCGVNGVIATQWTGYSGAGYADTTNAVGSAVSWQVNIPTAGNYTVSWRYANGGTDNRNVNVQVDGFTKLSNVAFPPTGAWGTWSSLSQTVSITTPGSHRFRIAATTATGTANIDRFYVGQGATGALCTAQ